MDFDPAAPSKAYLAFWQESHLCSLSTLRPDGTPHLVPVGVTYEPGAVLARIIASRSSKKVRNIQAAGPGGMRVAVCQVERGRWATLEGTAVVSDDPERVAEAVRRYSERYRREPGPNPERVVIEITVDRAIGNA
jgi:F420H(2)-dependent biliverdin reductase